jgi:hypothetical protein
MKQFRGADQKAGKFKLEPKEEMKVKRYVLMSLRILTHIH